jgi:hypothetical protein
VGRGGSIGTKVSHLNHYRRHRRISYPGSRGLHGAAFHEHLGKRHGYTLGYTVTKLHLQRAGLVVAARSRSAHRKKRPRRPLLGMLLHRDASTHAWLPGEARKYDLVAAIDDATSAIYSLFLVARRAQ